MRRPAWDEVQERQRRARERLDAERDALLAADPVRPANVWRVSGRRIDPPLWSETVCAGCGGRLILSYPGQRFHPEPCDPAPQGWTDEQLARWSR